MTAVIDLAEPPLQAAIMINISIMLSLTFELPLCTMKTFWFRMDVPILTLVSPFAKLPNSQLSGLVPSLSQMASVSVGCDLPEKILTFLMSEEKTALGQNVPPSNGQLDLVEHTFTAERDTKNISGNAKKLI